MKINNLPDYAKNSAFIVARLVDEMYWFYGAYDTADRAFRAAEEVDGAVFPVSEVIQ